MSNEDLGAFNFDDPPESYDMREAEGFNPLGPGGEGATGGQNAVDFFDSGSPDAYDMREAEGFNPLGPGGEGATGGDNFVDFATNPGDESVAGFDFTDGGDETYGYSGSDFPFSDEPPKSTGFGSLLDTAAGGIGNFVGSAVSSIANPILGRLKASGLLPGGGSVRGLAGGGSSSVRFIDGMTGDVSRDWKVKVTVNPAVFSFGGVLAPLSNDNGVIFPYTPQLSVTYQANYSTQRFTHSNYNHYAYENSEVQLINIASEFTAQNQKEANYVLACIYFFRTVTKMFFGSSNNQGNPPPLVFLNGYGDNYFSNVPCLVMSFNHVMPADVDYIETKNNSGTRVPTISTLQVGLQPVYSKQTLTKFDLDAFAQGQLVKRGLI